MAIGLEAKGYKESETRAGKRHRNRQKVAKRDERAQELSHKAAGYKEGHTGRGAAASGLSPERLREVMYSRCIINKKPI